MTPATLVVCLMTIFNIVISRNSMEDCKGVREPGRSKYPFGSNPPYDAYTDITEDAIIIPSQTYAINECNWDMSRDPHYSWKYTCVNINTITMAVYVATTNCDNTAKYSYTFTGAERIFNCDPNARDCLLSNVWSGSTGTNETNCQWSPGSYATTYLVSGGCAPDRTSWGTPWNNIWVSSTCHRQNHYFKWGHYQDEQCTLIQPTQGPAQQDAIIITGDCNGRPGIKAFACLDDFVTTTSLPVSTSIQFCGNGDEYFCYNEHGAPFPCINGQCDSQKFPIMCSDDSDCGSYVGLDYCQWSNVDFCTPDCNRLTDGNTFCSTYFGSGKICRQNGRCGYEACDTELDPTCSLQDYICRPKWNHITQQENDVCIESCTPKQDSDGWCASEREDDYSYKCQSYGECDRDECVNGVCSTGLVCDRNEGGENGECVISCDRNSTLCQMWNDGPDSQYYICNNHNLCEQQFPTCNNDTVCDDKLVNIPTYFGFGFRCDSDMSGRCYPAQCMIDDDCIIFGGGNYLFCDNSTNICSSLMDQDCSVVGCDWTIDAFPAGQGYGLLYSCDSTSHRCDRTYCDTSAECANGYWCLTYDQHYCVKNCNAQEDCYNYFGSANGDWQCDSNNNECIPDHGGGGGCSSPNDCHDGKICNKGECEAVICSANDNSNCIAVDSDARCQCYAVNDCICVVDECETGIDCKEEYFNSCFVDPGDSNKCYRDCATNADCNAIFGQNVECAVGGAPCNATTDPGCVQVKYCDMFKIKSCLFSGCHDSEVCDIPTGNCTIVTCDTNPSICRETFGALATCVEGECRDNECLIDSDCNGRVNKCFDQDPNDGHKCYSACETDANCETLYATSGIKCISGDPAGVGVTIKFCQVYELNFTLSPTPPPIPTDEPSISPTTEAPTACVEDEDLFLHRDDCLDNVCDVNEAYISFGLTFDVCTIDPFNGKKRGLWDKLVDCVCEMGLGANYDGTPTNSGDLSRRRRLGYGSSQGKCDLKVTQFDLPKKIGYTEIVGCPSEEASNSYRLTFGVEGCGACANIKNMFAGFKDISKDDAIKKIKQCVSGVGKQKMADGFKVVEIELFTYTFSAHADCTLDVNTSGVERKFNNNLLSTIIIGVMMMIYVLL